MKKTLTRRVGAFILAAFLLVLSPFGNTNGMFKTLKASAEDDVFIVKGYNTENSITDKDGKTVPGWFYCMDAKIKPPSVFPGREYTRIRLSELDSYEKEKENEKEKVTITKKYTSAAKQRLLKIMVERQAIADFMSNIDISAERDWFADKLIANEINVRWYTRVEGIYYDDEKGFSYEKGETKSVQDWAELYKEGKITLEQCKEAIGKGFDVKWNELTKSIQFLVWTCVRDESYWPTYVTDNGIDKSGEDEYYFNERSRYFISNDPLNDKHSLWNVLLKPTIDFIDKGLPGDYFKMGYDAWVYMTDDKGYQNMLGEAVVETKVDKLDITSYEELEGAHLQVLTPSGNVFAMKSGNKYVPAEWDSDGRPHKVKLLAGSYILRETVAPTSKNYVLTKDTKFNISLDGTVEVISGPGKCVNGVLEIYNDVSDIKIQKIDAETGKPLKDCRLVVTDESGKTVTVTYKDEDNKDFELLLDWVSDGKPYEIRGLKPGVEYYIKEIAEVDSETGEQKMIPGYTLNSVPQKFVINADGTVEYDESLLKDGVLLFPNKKTEVKIAKVDITSKKEIEGAKLQILDKDGNTVEEWTSDKTVHKVTGLKVGELYTLREITAPDGYTVCEDSLFKIDISGKVKYNGTTSKGVLLVEDTKTSVSISKVDIDGKELEGAKLQVIDSEGNVADEWTSTTEIHTITGLKTGVEYTLHEEIAPDGYTVASDTKFSMDEKGNVTSTGTVNANGVILVEDDLTSVSISKVDIAGSKELEGAKLQVIDGEGNVVEEWTSTTETHTITGLKTGVEYTLHEETAPDGYTVASDTTFFISKKGRVTSTGTINENGVILVEDALTSVSISKVEIAGGKELEGATLQVIDGEGNVVEEWTSTAEIHTITGLKTGVEYTLHEETAPEGYTVASDTTFSIDEKGNVTSTGTVNENGVILVEDALTSVSISKVEIAGGKELEGAKLQVIDSEGNVVDEWTSTADTHVITGLKTGVEYTLHEETAPEGYTVASDTKFSIDANGNVTSNGTVAENGVIFVEDALTSVSISKVDISGKELEGAKLQVIDSEGNVAEEWTSTTETHVITGLKADVEYTLHEETAPDGYTVASDTKFSVDENGNVTSTGTVTEAGVILVEDELTSVSISKVDIANGEELEGAKLQVIDSEGKVVEEWTSTTEAYTITGLKTGVEYTLHEETAPDGYTVASDTTFSIDENGNVTSTGTVTEDGVILVEDAAEKESSEADSSDSESSSKIDEDSSVADSSTDDSKNTTDDSKDVKAEENSDSESSKNTPNREDDSQMTTTPDDSSNFDSNSVSSSESDSSASSSSKTDSKASSASSTASSTGTANNPSTGAAASLTVTAIAAAAVVLSKRRKIGK